MFDAIFYMVRTGGPWRLLPRDLPPWRIVYYYSRAGARNGSGKGSTTPCATRRGGVRGYDAEKKILGRKRHLLVDTYGLILKVRVHAASIHDRDGAPLVLDQLDEPLQSIKRIWADGGYAGDNLRGWMEQRFGQRPLRMEIVRRGDAQKGFVVLPRRWVLERTFAWPTTSDASAKTTSSAPTPPNLSSSSPLQNSSSLA